MTSTSMHLSHGSPGGGIAWLRRGLAALTGVLLLAAAGAAPSPAAAQIAVDPTAWAPPGWRPGGAAPSPGHSGPVVVAARIIPSGVILTEGDLRLAASAQGGGLPEIAAAVGMETRTVLYAGRAVRAEDVGPPTLVARNALIVLRFRRGALLITAEGRALDRGSQGERIRAMNLSSRQTVTGRVAADGAIEVSP